MAKNTKNYYCNDCGARYPKWLGKCEDCGQWNTIVEDAILGSSKSATSDKKYNLEFVDLSSKVECIERKCSDVPEFDRVLGGGAVSGAIVLIGGDPGIGKSTLLLQVLAAFSQNYNCIYISGEESIEQIKLRAMRLGVSESGIMLACSTNVNAIINSFSGDEDFVVIDSIQTLFSDTIESIPGTVTQVKSCAYELINYAKNNNTTIFLVGHVTKDGSIAGPKILEHMVDTVLYFEGERGNNYRILRSVKNRYGPSDELGIFEMRQVGLIGVSNPSVLFLSQRKNSVPGTVVFAGVEGTRPLLVESQALVAKSYFPAPKRTVVGWDINRLFMILAVLETKCKISFSDRDVYFSIAGGLRVAEPACDLAAAISLISARNNIVLPNDTCAFGEIGLTGEIRDVAKYVERVKEAEKLGFKTIITPIAKRDICEFGRNIELIQVENLTKLVSVLNEYSHGL